MALDQEDLEADAGGLAGDPGPGDPAADDDQIPAAIERLPDRVAVADAPAIARRGVAPALLAVHGSISFPGFISPSGSKARKRAPRAVIPSAPFSAGR